MESHKICTPEGGFTLIEILITLSLLAVVCACGVVLGLQGYEKYLFHSDRDELVFALEEARAQALSGICAGSSCTGPVAHGVHLLSTSQLVIFQGNTFSATDAGNEYLPLHGALSWSGATDIIFSALSATTSSTTLTLTNPTSTLSITSQGGLNWSN